MAATDKKSKNLFSKKDRGTTDDLEVLLMILKENPGIRRKVMEKVKQAKSRIEIEQQKLANQQQTV